MPTIVVASRNPVKIEAVLGGFQRLFPQESFSIASVEVPSGVRPQPISDPETLHGALQRSAQAARQSPTADFWVGVEGGIADQEGEMAAFAWVVVRGPGRCGKARSGTFYLPPAVAALVRQGKELGEADDLIFGRANSKQENGAIGILSGDVLNRAQLYEQAVILALLPFKNPQLYPAET